jgi:hypothetical protein
LTLRAVAEIIGEPNRRAHRGRIGPASDKILVVLLRNTVGTACIPAGECGNDRAFGNPPMRTTLQILRAAPFEIETYLLQRPRNADNGNALDPCYFSGVSPRLGFVEVCGNDQVVAGICLVRFIGALIIGVDLGYSLVRATRRRVNDRLPLMVRNLAGT